MQEFLYGRWLVGKGTQCLFFRIVAKQSSLLLHSRGIAAAYRARGGSGETLTNTIRLISIGAELQLARRDVYKIGSAEWQVSGCELKLCIISANSIVSSHHRIIEI